MERIGLPLDGILNKQAKELYLGIKEKAQVIATDPRIWPPLNLPHSELGQYRERFEASYASALTLQGVAYEDCKAAKEVLGNLQRGGGSVSQAVWKRVEEAESAFRSADLRVKEMRRSNETHWIAQVEEINKWRALCWSLTSSAATRHSNFVK